VIGHVNTIVIGGGQAGLSVGYHLAQRGVPFVILDASARIGDAWRHRWDSLRLFTPARFAGLDGLPFPAPRHSFPTKDQMADYLETYARTFRLPVRSGVRVDRLSREGARLVAVAGDRRYEADQVVIAMANYQRPRVPPFAHELAPHVVHLHSGAYRTPAQLQGGPVLVVGAGNSGAEIAVESARHGHQTWLAGRPAGVLPFRIDGIAARWFGTRFFLRVLYHRVLTIRNPLGRFVRARSVHHAAPLVRTKPKDLETAGVLRVPRVSGVHDGLPMLADGQVLDVANVIWCTGYDEGFSWIDLPVLAPDGQPIHDGGVVTSEPGLYFVGLHFLYAFSSEMIHGVGRDAARIANHIAFSLSAD
jgi:putative flavoprotein involved in K+ transport